MKVLLSALTLLLAVASAAVSLSVGAEEVDRATRVTPTKAKPRAGAAVPAAPASAPLSSANEPHYLCACVRMRTHA